MTKWVGSAGLLLVLSVTNAHQAIAAEPGKKEAWEYSLDERLEMRFGPDTGAEIKPPDAGRSESDKAVSVDGSSHPELLLPFELFRSLLRNAYNPIELTQELYREKMDPLLHSLGFEDGFWDELELIAEDTLTVDRERRRITKDRSSLSKREQEELSQRVDELYVNYCQDSARILAAATETFGKERLYKLLYQGVAPSVGVTSVGSTPEQMRFVAGGCQ